MGEIVTIQLRTYWTYPDRTPPADFPSDYPMLVAAFAPDGRRVELRLVQEPRDPHVWRGAFRFPERGRWTDLRMPDRAAEGRPGQPRLGRSRLAREATRRLKLIAVRAT